MISSRNLLEDNIYMPPKDDGVQDRNPRPQRGGKETITDSEDGLTYLNQEI